MVERETDAIKFLTIDGWNPWASAERICKYWTVRRNYFSDDDETDRWLLPFDLSGKGAMREPEIHFLRTGALAMSTNRMGQQVLIFDLKRTQRQTEYIIRARCSMYLATLLATDVSRKQGLDLLLCANAKGVRPESRNGELILRKNDNSTIARARHICVVHDFKDIRKMLVRFCGVFVSQIIHRLTGTYPHMVCEDTPQATRNKLSQIGIYPDCVPEEYGGTWNAENYCRMMEERIKEDTRQRSRSESTDLHDLKIAAQESQNIPQQSIYLKTPAESIPQPVGLGALDMVTSSNNTEEPPQSLNAASAPEMYTTSHVLQTCAELDKTNPKANRDKSFYLKRNAVYSKRNYLRKKERDSALQKEHEQLCKQKEVLQQENQRLETLLAQARSLLDDPSMLIRTPH